MKRVRVLLVLTLAASVSASATTIPPDLDARAAELRRQAPPQVLTWAHDQGLAFARASGPVDVVGLERNIRSQFGTRRALTAPPPAGRGTTNPNLGNLSDSDIMALCFIVMMDAAKSAQEDLKAIMDGVKLINKQKDGLRSIEDTVNKLDASHASNALKATPTPVPDRLSQLVAAAQSVAGKTQGASLAAVAHR
jgi:hypothetical protein